MLLNICRLVVATFAISGCTAAPPTPYPYGRSTIGAQVVSVPYSGGSFASDMLKSHNDERAAVAVRPLVWDTQIGAAAAAYATELAASGTLRHSQKGTRQGQGENLWIGTRGAFPPRAMVANWASEKSMFLPGIFPNVSRTRNWADVAHYTQIIWPETVSLGCGIGSSRQFDVLVCRYSPAGNRDARSLP